jgi:protein TonB
MALAARANGERLRAGLPMLAIHALIAWALLRGLGIAPSVPLPASLKLFEIAPEVVPPEVPPPPPPPPADDTSSQRPGDPRDEGAASPPNLQSRANEVTAPTRDPLRPQPLDAAAKPGTGSAATQGAAPVRGPGTGSGGFGDGTGSGDGGGGEGAGGGGGYGDGRGLRPPRRLRGRLRDSDYRGLGEPGLNGRVSVQYQIEADGRVSRCSITRSSGFEQLDRRTCALIQQRFRFDPARDRFGRPIRSNLIENYDWIIEDLPPEERIERRRRRVF